MIKKIIPIFQSQTGKPSAFFFLQVSFTFSHSKSSEPLILFLFVLDYLLLESSSPILFFEAVNRPFLLFVLLTSFSFYFVFDTDLMSRAMRDFF